MKHVPVTGVTFIFCLLISNQPGRMDLAFAADHPISIALGSEPNTAIVGQERGGSLILVDYAQGTVLRTLGQFGTLTDFDRLTSESLIVTATAPPRLVIVSTAENAERPREIVWPIQPTAVRVSASREHVAVLHREDRSVACLTTAAIQTDSLDRSLVRKVSLPFQPGRCLWLPDGRHLIVTDAYGGRLAVVDAPNGRLVCACTLSGHNISGLALSSDRARLYLTHQILYDGASTTYDDIHWGNLLTNVVRSLTVSELLDPHADLLAHSQIVPVGQTGRATGDPAAMAVRSDGELIVTLAGVNELALQVQEGQDWQRVAVGARPTAITLTHDGQQALVANTLDNTLSVVELTNLRVVGRTISLGPAPIQTAADRGERLFFDARLSHDGWMSCHSCHPGGHTIGQRVDNFSDGTEHTAKRILSLRGVRDTAPYAWDGRFATLAEQVRHSITSTMQGNPPSEDQVQDLVAFLETLSVPENIPDPSSRSLIAAGKIVFERLQCGQCHAAPTFTSPATYDVGLVDEQGQRKFNPPSLRGVRLADSFFHDARLSKLEDVFRQQQHQLEVPLNEDELHALLAFLRSN